MKKTKMLKKNYEFKKVLSRGNFFYGNFIILVVLENNQSRNYLGLALSSKLGKAVRRNRIKRLIRESYYFFEENIENGKSMIFLWKKNVSMENVKFLDIKDDMEKILSKADILK